MMDEIAQRARKGKTRQARLNLLREELHHLLLQETDRQGGFSHLCFVGGTALRVLYGLDRFSEDLDFSTSVSVKKPFELAVLIVKLHRSLRAFEIDCQITPVKTVTAVHSCFFRFAGLLAKVDPSFREGQKL